MPIRHEVQPGDCVTSLAFDAGFFPDTVWNDGENAELKQKRKEMNLLEPGDVVVIPDLRVKEESGGTDAKHKFRRKGVPAKLKIKVLKRPEDQGQEELEERQESEAEDAEYDEPEEKAKSEEEPWDGCPYRLEIDGKSIEGTTDGQGMVEQPIPPNAKEGKLIMSPGQPDEMVILLKLGTLGDKSEIPGVKRRMANLGFDCGNQTDQDTDVDEEFSLAVKAFQEFYELEDITGQLDDPTKAKLDELCES
jgi:hypothetical protein